MKRKWIIILAIVLVAAAGFLVVRGTLARIESSLESLRNEPVAVINLTAINDGTYSGSYSVFPVSAEVKVTVENHAITGIELVKHTHGQGAPAEVIPGKVIEAQSLHVDSVSGATYSSRVILKAIENALLTANQ